MWTLKPQSQRASRFGSVLPVRLTPEVKAKLLAIAKAAGITSSDALRMAVNHGIPTLESGRLPLNQSKAKEEVAA